MGSSSRVLCRASLAIALAAVSASCETDGHVDWRGGEWREQVWRSYPAMGQGNPSFTGHGFAPTAIGTTAMSTTAKTLSGSAGALSTCACAAGSS